ncbi:MAG: hypothetical protein L0H25_01750 [Micrococcales bacterium]|nr:hypothetical protein [Micrococcales bacterium]
MDLFEVTLRADQVMHVGAGKGSGFSSTSMSYVPASMFRGAIAARWWRLQPDADQQDFEDLIASVSFADAVVRDEANSGQPTLPLDRGKCKYPVTDCPPEGHRFDVATCETCGGRPQRPKGQRELPSGAGLLPSTRVALDRSERAKDDQLYRREALALGEHRLTARVAGTSEGLTRLGLVERTALRFGGSRSVAGRVHIESVSPTPIPPVTVTRKAVLRVELETLGVYVDDFGFPTPYPSPGMLRHSLGLDDATGCDIVRGFTRWAVAAGWHSKANSPKSQDFAVIPHSVFHVQVTPPPGAAVSVPSVVNNLGLRCHEGCGWAAASALGGDDA